MQINRLCEFVIPYGSIELALGAGILVFGIWTDVLHHTQVVVDARVKLPVTVSIDVGVRAYISQRSTSRGH
jgi:hypothetical protein